MAIDDYSFRVKIALLADDSDKAYVTMVKWCLKNLSRDSWLHDQKEFMFKSQEDYTQFVMCWK